MGARRYFFFLDGDLVRVRVAVLDLVRVAVGDLLAGGSDEGMRVRDTAGVRVATMAEAEGVRAAVGEATLLTVRVGAAVEEPARLALLLVVALVDTDALGELESDALLDAVPLRDTEAVPEELGVEGGVPIGVLEGVLVPEAVLVPAPLADGVSDGTVVPVAEPVPGLLGDRVNEGDGGA